MRRNIEVGFGKAFGKPEIGILDFPDFVQCFHGQGFFLGRADINAVVTAGTIKRRNLDPVAPTLGLLTAALLGDKCLRCIGQVFRSGQVRPDCGMRADKRALVALDAVFRKPNRYLDGNTAFFIASRSGGNDTVRAKAAYRKIVPLSSTIG